MIKIGRISDIGTDFDENLLIVRSAKNIPKHAVWEPLLSPSKQLFHSYLEAKKAGWFDENWFQQNYVPQFLHEMASSHAARDLLNRLYVDSRSRNILLACYCTDEKLCHRSILAGMLLGAGASIECIADYRKYWDMFRQIT